MNQTAIDPATGRNTKNFQTSQRREAGKTELLDGKIVARRTANRWHNLIAANFAIALGGRIQKSQCELYVNDMQVQIGKNSVCFPDVAVVAGEPVFADERSDMLLNPTVLVEIFSAATASVDRMQKLEGFLSIENIKECVLVNEGEMRVEHYARQNAKQWIYRIYNERDDVISLDSINCKVSLAEVYAQVKLRESELSSRAVN